MQISPFDSQEQLHCKTFIWTGTVQLQGPHLNEKPAIVELAGHHINTAVHKMQPEVLRGGTHDVHLVLDACKCSKGC